MKLRNDFSIISVLILGDILAVNAAFLFSYWFRFFSGLFSLAYGIPDLTHYSRILPILTIIMIFLFRSDKLYFVRSRLSIVDEFFSVVRSVSVGIMVFMAGTFLYREFSFSRGMLILAWGVLILFMSIWRFFVNRVRFAFRAKSRNLLILGDGEMVIRLISHISGDPHWDYDIRAVLRLRPGGVGGEIADVPVYVGLERLGEILGKYDIDEVIVTEADMPRQDLMNVVLECDKNMAEVRIVADLLGMVTSQVDMRTIDGVPLLGLKESPLAEWMNRAVKRTMDIFVSLLAMVICSPILLVVAAAVKLSSPGSVFYFQKRIGEDGRRFAIIKFRTMIENAEKGVGPVWARKDDPRRTPIGTFLRSTNLDELPQLINVIKGEMSLVGPRPERPHFVGKFKQDIPRYMARHKIKSGMTGWAQVNGLRGNTSIEERTKYDLYYVENWSVMFDIKILFMSVFAMKNAY
jgi:exopolysaccharide biosynthesis polyprenyl glycosylphosphotransferase